MQKYLGTYNVVNRKDFDFSNDTYVSFDYHNANWSHKRFFGKATYLFDDWLDEAIYCPANSDVVNKVTFYSDNKTTSYIDFINFEDLMILIREEIIIPNAK